MADPEGLEACAPPRSTRRPHHTARAGPSAHAGGHERRTTLNTGSLAGTFGPVSRGSDFVGEAAVCRGITDPAALRPSRPWAEYARLPESGQRTPSLG